MSIVNPLVLNKLLNSWLFVPAKVSDFDTVADFILGLSTTF